VIGREGEETDAGVWVQMIRDADMNGDGQIDFDEFLKMMYSLKESTAARSKS
jgi:Ca2+-binding EF-hand superfamily protein